MKTGKVAKLFGIDPKTVTGWTDEFPEFFSAGARGEGKTQRDYTPDDLIVLNTIKADRTNRVDLETTRAKLNAGIRDTVLPPEAPQMNPQNALAVYGQLKVMEAALATANSEIDRLREEGKAKQDRIEQLNREIGELTAELRIIKRDANGE